MYLLDLLSLTHNEPAIATRKILTWQEWTGLMDSDQAIISYLEWQTNTYVI